MTKMVYLCGPIAPDGQSPNGGYAAANARTIAAMMASGRPICAMPYPFPQGTGIGKLWAYIVGFRRLLVQLETQTPGVLHITGLYKQFVLPELLLLRKAKRLGYLTVYDIRAGSMLLHYSRLGVLYRGLFRHLLKRADRVMVEGLEYETFVQQVTGKIPFYFPNHLDIDEVGARSEPSPRDTPVLIYVGRVTLDKGVTILLEAARELRSRGRSSSVRIVGPVAPSLQQRLALQYRDVNAQWLGSRAPEEVLAQLRCAHFFLFPTRHRGEGHSNALTEAMSSGCVVLASPSGFNTSVIGDCGVILPQHAGGRAYAETIEDIWTQGKWGELSARAQARAKMLYDSRSVIARLQEEYRLLEGV